MNVCGRAIEISN